MFEVDPNMTQLGLRVKPCPRKRPMAQESRHEADTQEKQTGAAGLKAEGWPLAAVRGDRTVPEFASAFGVSSRPDLPTGRSSFAGRAASVFPRAGAQRRGHAAEGGRLDLLYRQIGQLQSRKCIFLSRKPRQMRRGGTVRR